MARDTDSIFLSADIWALTGDRTAPTFPLNTGWGPQYEQDPNTGGLLPERQNFNDEFYRLTLINNLLTTAGACLEWSSIIPYVKSALVIGSDNELYFSVQANSNEDPTTDDGTNWVKLNAYRETSGQIKILSYNGVSEDKPVQNLVTTSGNTLEGPFDFEYGANLNFSSSPTNQFPIMDPNKNDASIWDDTNKKFRDNNSLGQVQDWRFIFSYSRTTFEKVQVIIRLFNEDSLFETVEKIYFSEERVNGPGTDTGMVTVNLQTIADNESVAPNRGYFLQALIYGDNGADIEFTLENVTRFSYANSNPSIYT